MIPLDLAEAADVLHAPLPGGSASTVPIRGLAVDSRRVEPGTLFVALPGERVDGHDFVPAAFAGGAAAAVTTRTVPEAAGPVLVVADPVDALGRLARQLVDQGRAGGLRVVGITGSQGKTSTKDLLAQVLEPVAATVAPHGNFNNEVGLPLTVARVELATRFLVAEMGARGVGHIAYLCGIAPPDVAVVLNVGQAHLSEFGSREAIGRAKGELVEALPAAGTAVLQADDPLVWAMRERTTAATLGFSGVRDPGTDSAAWAEDVASDELGRARFRLRLRRDGDPLDPQEVQLQVTGRHQVLNALAAAGAALALGLRPDQIGAGLAAAGPRSRWRMELHRRDDGLLVVNDAYNANPDSMRAAVDTTVGLRRTGGRVWAVLGDMLELGPAAPAEHAALGAYAAERGVDRLLALGAFAADLVEGATSAPESARHAAVMTDKDAAAEVVRREAGPADVVLVKASRGLALDTVADDILAGPASVTRRDRP